MKKHLFAVIPILLFPTILQAQTIDLGEIVTIIDNPEKVELRIDSEEIKKSASTSLPELLKQKGMLVMSSGGNGTASNFSFKGYAGFCCKVYIDGVLATQPGTGEFDWNSIDINSIESITVSEIPDTTTDQFAGCVVHIKTRLVSARGFDVKALVTSYENSIADTVSVAGEYRDVIGNTGFKLNAQVNNADNNYETPAPEDSKKTKGDTLENNWSRMYNISGSFNTLVSDNFTVSGTSKLFRNQVKAFNTGSSLKLGLEDDLNAFNTLKARFVTTNLAVLSVNATSQYNSIVYNETETKKDTTKMHQGDLLFTAENFYGFEASSVFSLENKITGTKQQRLHNTTKVAWNTNCLFDRDSRIPQWITVTPCAGILVSSNSDFEFLPQLTVSSRRTGLSVSAFRQFVLPTFNQLYWDGGGGVGNLDLTPEEGWEVVSSWKSPFVFLPFSVTYTYAKYGNKIRWSYSGGKLTPMNTIGATYKTLELRASKSWKYLELNGGVTNTQALLEDGKQIMWVPEWQYNCGALAHIGPVDAGVTVSYTGRRPQDNWNFYWYDEYTDLGANLSWHVAECLTLMVTGKNLLDQRVYYHDSYPMPSRSVTCGIRIEN